MHIALCDSNIADRKQMERLLTRESDHRIRKGGVMYIDTFGSYEALLSNPMVYDAYFLDVTDISFTAYDIAKELRKHGILSPVIYCISTLDYHNCGELLPNSVFLNKPIRTDELSLILDEIMLQQKESHIPKIEFRNQTETFYLTEKELVYCEGEGCTITLHLKDGSIKKAGTFIENLYMELTSFPRFYMINKKTIVNTRYISELSCFSLSIGTFTTKINPLVFHEIKKLMTRFHES